MGRRSRRAQVGSEDGAVSAAYVALLALVASLVAALLALGLSPRLRAAGLEAVCRLFDLGPCGGSPTASFVPPPCEVGSRSTRDGFDVDVAVVHAGLSFGFTRTEFADGRTTLTFVDSTEIGATAGVGFGARDGEAGLRVGAEVGGTLAAESGWTWTFDTPADADAAEAWLRREVNEGRRGRTIPLAGPINGFVEWMTGEPPPPPPDGSSWRSGIHLDATADAVVGPAAASTGVSAAVLVGRQTDLAADTVTTTHEVAFTADAAAHVLGLGAGRSAATTGTVAVTRDVAGQVVAVELVHQRDGGLSALATGTTTLADLADGLDITAEGEHGTARSVVTTTRVEPADAAERAVVERWLAPFAGVGPAWRAATGASAVGPFADLLSDRATVSVVEYESTSGGVDVAAGAALGLELGAGIEALDTDARAVDAYYLDAPRDGVRALVPDVACREAAA